MTSGEWRRAVGASALVCLVACGGGGGGGGGSSSTSAPGAPQWAQSRGGPKNQGRADVRGPVNGGVQWARDLGDAVTDAVTVDGLGRLFVKPSNRHLVSLHADGRERWRVSLGAGARAPVVDRFGSTYVGTDAGTLFKVSSDGRVVRSQSVGARILSGFAYDEDRILFPVENGRLLVYDTSLMLRFEVAVGGLLNALPVLVSPAQMFIPSTDGNLYEIQIDLATKVPVVGAVLPLGAPVSHATPCSDGKHVYVVTDEEVLIKGFRARFDDEEPRALWRFDPESAAPTGRSAPALARDGTILYGTEDGRLLAVQPDGMLRWSQVLGAAVRSAIVLDGQDTVHVRTVDGVRHAFTLDGERRSRRGGGAVGVGSAEGPGSFDAQGRLFYGTSDGVVMCVSDLPSMRQLGFDAGRSGRSGQRAPSDPDLRWVASSASSVQQTLLLADGGLVQLSDAGTLRQLSASGRLRAVAEAGAFATSVVAGDDGQIHVATSRGQLQSFERLDGAVRTVTLSESALTPLAVLADGSLRTSSVTGTAFALDADGSPNQSFPIVGSDVPVAVSTSGELVVAGRGGVLVRYDVEGRERARTTVPGPITHSAPVVDDDGAVYVATDRDLVTRWSPTDEGWLFDFGTGRRDGGVGGPVLLGDEALAHLSVGGVLRVLERETGAVTALVDVEGTARFPPVIDRDGNLVVATSEVLAVYAPDGALQSEVSLASLAQGELASAPLLTGDGACVLSFADGTVVRLQDGAPWSGFHGTADQAGRSRRSGPRAASVTWSLDLDERVDGPPVLDGAGRTLVQDADGFLHQVSSDGSLERSLAIGDGVGIPLVDDAGLRVASTTLGAIIAHDEDGAQAWFRSLGSPAGGLGRTLDGLVLVSTDDARLHALDRDGETQWSVSLGGVPAPGPAATGADGRVRVVLARGEVVCVDDGARCWRSALPARVGRGSPAVAPDGTTWITLEDDRLIAVDVDGQQRTVDDPAASGTDGGVATPALTVEGDVVYGTQDGDVRAVTVDGVEVWAFAAGASISGSPAIDGEGVVYVGTDDGRLIALRGDGVELFTATLSTTALRAVAIAADGSLRVVDRDGVLFRLD